MDNKILGSLIVIAVAVMVGVAFLTTSADNVGKATTTVSIVNQTYICGNNGTYTDIDGYQAIIGTYSVYNTSSGASIGTSNITVVDRVGTDGLKTVSIYNHDQKWNSTNISIVATFAPDGYIEDGGGRTIAGLIVLFTALAIAIVALYPSIKNKFGLD